MNHIRVKGHTNLVRDKRTGAILNTNRNEIARARKIKDIKNKELSKTLLNSSISDFDLFVYRAHVLSSKENSESIVNKINNGGLPAFFEVFEENDKLFAVYVGPFVLESDIVNNMDTIKRLSESQNGEILRWKLSD